MKNVTKKNASLLLAAVIAFPALMLAGCDNGTPTKPVEKKPELADKDKPSAAKGPSISNKSDAPKPPDKPKAP